MLPKSFPMAVLRRTMTS